MSREPKLPSPRPDLGPPPKGAGGPPPKDLTPEALRRDAAGIPDEWVPVIALDRLPEGAPPPDILVDYLADQGVSSAIVSGTTGYGRGIPTPPRLFAHAADAERARRLIEQAARDAEAPDPAGGDQAEREIEELREHDWRQPVSLTVPDGILIGVLVLAILLWLLRGYLLGG